jgi:polyphenol oxidase
MFTIEKKNSISYMQADIFRECDFLTHAFCTRQGGASEDDYKSLNMSFSEGDEDSKVLQNWGRLAAAFDIPLEQFLVVNQVHGDAIYLIKPYGSYFTSRAELDYDAIITDRTELAICIKTADCVPILIVDKIKKVIAVVHAGWRGSALNITAKVIQLMMDHYHSCPQDILAAIGPSIGKCCYQVDLATAKAFASHKNKEAFLFPDANGKKWMLDLPEVNRQQILECGVPEKNIEQSCYCTRCNQDIFFSHRGAGGITGRQINFMMIKDNNPCMVVTLNKKEFWRE